MAQTKNAESFGKRVIELGKQLVILEKRLLSPDRTVEDLIKHIELVKQLRSLCA